MACEPRGIDSDIAKLTAAHSLVEGLTACEPRGADPDGVKLKLTAGTFNFDVLTACVWVLWGDWGY
jgi:hypothetical protein